MSLLFPQMTDLLENLWIIVMIVSYLRQRNVASLKRSLSFSYVFRRRATWIPRAVFSRDAHACNGAGTQYVIMLSLSRCGANMYADTKIIVPNCSAVACSCKCHTRIDGAT